MGKVKLDTSITSFTDETGGRSFVLDFAVTIDTPFDISVSDMSPQCCFVYNRDPDAAEPVYAGICTVSQFLTAPADPAESDTFRTNTFHLTYRDYNTPVADQQAMIAQITEFYHNLNAYIDSYSEQLQTVKSFIVPDYSDVTLDRLISQWRAVKLSLMQDEMRLDVKKNIYKPLIDQAALLISGMKTAVDKISVINKEEIDNFSDTEDAETALGELYKQASKASAEKTSNLESFNNVKTDLDKFNQAITNFISTCSTHISDSDLRQLLFGEYDSVNHEWDTSQALAASLKQLVVAAKTDLSGFTFTTALDIGTVDSARAAVMPILDWLRTVSQNNYSSLEDISGLKTAVADLLAKFEAQQSQTEADINALNASIEGYKSLLQTLEANMIQIRPTIDLSNPETAWFFTVNIS